MADSRADSAPGPLRRDPGDRYTPPGTRCDSRSEGKLAAGMGGVRVTSNILRSTAYPHDIRPRSWKYPLRAP